MKTGKALEIVFNMAKFLYKEEGIICSPAKNPSEVEDAFNTIEDLVVDNFEDDSKDN